MITKFKFKNIVIKVMRDLKEIKKNAKVNIDINKTEEIKVIHLKNRFHKSLAYNSENSLLF